MNNTVGTTRAAFLLNISVSRVKVLLQQERIKGAKKSGRVWKIPLIKGIPKVQGRGRGLRGTWRRKRSQQSTVIHVNKPQCMSSSLSTRQSPSLRCSSLDWGYSRHCSHSKVVDANANDDLIGYDIKRSDAKLIRRCTICEAVSVIDKGITYPLGHFNHWARVWKCTFIFLMVLTAIATSITLQKVNKQLFTVADFRKV